MLFKNSIEIIINPYEEVNITNLYIIIKSYSTNLIYVPSSFYAMINNKNDKSFMILNFTTDEFKNITYYGFLNWYYEKLEENWKYIKENGTYSFIFTYTIKVFNMDNLEYLKPIYPWNSFIIEKIGMIREDVNLYIETIKSQEKEINRLKNLLQDYENMKKK